MSTNITRAACTLIMNEEGQILAVSRKDDPNAFGLPGGKLEELETSMQAAIRETLEETGYHIILDPWSPFVMKEGNSVVITYKATIDLNRNKEQLDSSETGRVSFISPSQLLTGPFKEYNSEMLDYFKVNKV